MKQRNTHFIDGKPFNIFIGLVVLTIWGATYVIIRVTVRDNPPTIPPLSLAFMRFLSRVAFSIRQTVALEIPSFRSGWPYVKIGKRSVNAGNQP